MGVSAALPRERWTAVRVAARGVERAAPWVAWPATWVLVVAAAVTAAVLLAGHFIPWLAWDTGAYWDALNSPHPYEGSRVGGLGAYLYSPVFLQLLAPLRLLTWPLFLFGWTALNTATALALIRRVPRAYGGLIPLLVALATLDVWAGNINLLLAYAVVIGFRHRSAWAFVLVTKVSPGIGLAWFAFQRRWREVLLTLALTALIVTASYALSPALWADWLSLLATQVQPGIYPQAIPLSVFVRFPLALLVLWWSARTNRRWPVAVAAFLCLPVIWINGLAVLVGAAALLEPPQPRR